LKYSVPPWQVKWLGASVRSRLGAGLLTGEFVEQNATLDFKSVSGS
jgi:hypothetical protein